MEEKKEKWNLGDRQLYAYVLLGNTDMTKAYGTFAINCGQKDLDKDYNWMSDSCGLIITHDKKKVMEVLEKEGAGKAWLFPQMQELEKPEVNFSVKALEYKPAA